VHRFATAVGLGAMFALVLAASARADDKKGPEDPTKRLDVLVGDWDVAVRYKLPDGKEYEGKAACVTRRVLNDRFIQQEYTSRLNDQPLVVWQLLGFDTLKKQFVETQLHVHGDDTHTMHTEGTFADDGKVLTLRGDSLDGFTGKPVKLRTVTTIKDKDHYTVEWFSTDDSGKEERKVVLTHTRKK
jgi:hypothetical protein